MMRVIIISLMAAGLLAGCNKGKNGGLRVDPTVPYPLTVETIHSGTKYGKMYTLVTLKDGSTYLRFSDSMSQGFYRYDIISKRKDNVARFTGYVFSEGHTDSSTSDGSLKFDGDNVTFEGRSPAGHEQLKVEMQQIKPENPATYPWKTLPSSAFNGKYSVRLHTQTRPRPVTFTIANGAVTFDECNISAIVKPSTNASVARLVLTVPDGNGCGLKPQKDVTGIVMMDSPITGTLMADKRGTWLSEGVFGEFKKTAE
ncbi:hypothetical protein WM40_22375 [Robbsia andropogonis]|uniref:Lipoprotein n=2 Tax=Robbsia andropogonis TaxID=28092 RepID=A0A0F5JUP1_9BURK|nr:hypothetical protein [Robbsia andropogonis]KKB61563.1 hypothetical protein WM40_22375 [Robbsia andropogonis]